jgi:hypothetical protein
MIQDTRVELAAAITAMWQRVDPELPLWERVNGMLRMYNQDLAQYVREMMASTNDPEAKIIIASTAWVVYRAMWNVLGTDPKTDIDEN